MTTPKVGNDADVMISRDHQKKINTFAIRNGWMEELNEELKSKQEEVKNLEDAEGDIMLLDDPEITIPILIGESYVHFDQEKSLEVIQEMQVKAREDVKVIEKRIGEVRDEMTSLKNDLYSKFGDNINLENEEEP